MQVQVLEREFNYNSVKLPDPNAQMSIEEVKEEEVKGMDARQYPELLTAASDDHTARVFRPIAISEIADFLAR